MKCKNKACVICGETSTLQERSKALAEARRNFWSKESKELDNDRLRTRSSRRRERRRAKT